MSRVKIGIIGSQFEADIHAASIQMGCHGEVVACCSTPGNPEKLAAHYGIPKAFHDYTEMLKDLEIEAVTIAAPNVLHCQMTVDAANAGKHVICEKPLCMTLEEADEMIEACERNGVHLFYAEELFFTPKYVKAKEMADQGAFGEVYREAVRDALRPARRVVLGRRALGWRRVHGHGLPACVLLLVPRPPEAGRDHRADGDVRARRDHEGRRPRVRDRRVRGRRGRLRRGLVGPARRHGRPIEVYGSEGVTYGNLHMGNALPTFSVSGYGYAVEKAPTTQGWSYPVFEELWNYGFPQEMEHFAAYPRDGGAPGHGARRTVAQEADARRLPVRRLGPQGRAPVPLAEGVARPIDLGSTRCR